METLLQDLKFGVRGLLKAKGFTLAAVLALALGLGANTALFTVVDGVMLRPLPFRDPGRLVAVTSGFDGDEPGNGDFSLPDYRDFAANLESFSALGAYHTNAFALSAEGSAERVPGAAVSASTFALLGVRPALGRLTAPEEDLPNAQRVVLLSHALWKRRFGGDPAVVGKSIDLDGQSTQVVGVMPERFRFPLGDDEPAELWLPLGASAFSSSNWNNRGAHTLTVLGRLGPGVTVEQARAEARAYSEQLARDYRDSNLNWRASAVGLHELLVRDGERSLWLLLGAVGFVLLLACANVANLLLARAVAREREIAVRAALGASRGRIVRQLVTESVLLSLVGAAAGVVVCLWTVDALVAWMPPELASVGTIEVDGRVLAFAGVLAVVTGVLFGLAPALHASGTTLNQSLRQAGRTSGGRGQGRLRAVLVAAEVATAAVLLCGAGLMVKSFWKLTHVDTGLDERVVSLQLQVPSARYPALADRTAVFQRALEKVQAIPGVEKAALAFPVPYSDANIVIGFQLPGAGPNDRTAARLRIVSGGYVQTAGMRLMKGRDLGAGDVASAPPVILVNEAFVHEFFPGQDALGQRFTLGLNGLAPVEVVGLVSDVRNGGVDSPPEPEMYVSYAQAPFRTTGVVLRTHLAPAAVEKAARAQLAEVDSQIPVHAVRRLGDMIADTLAPRRFTMSLLLVLAGLALVLAALGIYSVMSYSVEQRTREMGIRMALGARAQDVVRLVMAQALKVAGAGLLVGVLGALALTGALSTLLYEVSPTDPVTFGAIVVLLGGISVLASFVPARRATRVDPQVALRGD